ncbi:MAG TPA: exosortase/archaeosortase family protein [Candidatus Acidoferrum sp.]
MRSDSGSNDRRFLFYAAWLLLSVALFWKPYIGLVRFSLANENASHIVLVPFISLWLIYLEKKKIFQHVAFGYSLAGVLFVLSAAAYLSAWHSAVATASTDVLSLYALALVLFWISGFVLFFGAAAAKHGRFSLFLLFLAIPLPEVLLNPTIYYLQKGSADIAGMIFDLTGVPALREGFVFHLARVNIEVAKECSGIRSSLALLILALLVGHLFLRKFWKQAVFVIAGILVMIIKNGVRIATLTILAQYVDPSFLFGRLHHDGGVVFFLLGLLLLWPILWLLQRGEKSEGMPVVQARG